MIFLLTQGLQQSRGYKGVLGEGDIFLLLVRMDTVPGRIRYQSTMLGCKLHLQGSEPGSGSAKYVPRYSVDGIELFTWAGAVLP